MKRILLLAAVLVTAMQAWSAPVDAATARATAQQFMLSQNKGRGLHGPSSADLRLLHAEANSTLVGQTAYYIFDTDPGFIIVAGDDRAQAILAHGDRDLDMGRMPENMKFWLSTYKRQLEFLEAHPDLVVEAPALGNPDMPAIQPLLSANWDQLEPYNLHCPELDGELCVTGCPATSLSMVLYYWKYPTQPIPAVNGYINLTGGFQVPALPSTTFDWDNMLDNYEGVDYTYEQAEAVAWLMRYVGQIERMDYSPEGSGAQADDILRAVQFLGYDETAELVTKSYADYFGNDIPVINDEDWATMLQNELIEGRPVVYCAFDYSSTYGWSGHAFNVDGYTPADNTYHVNWGWSGIGNGDFVLNAFSYGRYTFNVEQQMIIGIQPPVTTPTLRVSPLRLSMEAYVDQSSTASFNVKGLALAGDVTLTLNYESGSFALDASHIGMGDAFDGVTVTVTYSPLVSGSHTATVTLSSPEAEDVIVTLYGTSQLETFVPTVLPADSAHIGLTQFRADWTDQTADKYVSSYTLEVNTKPGTVLLDEADWSNLQENSTNYAGNPEALIPEGWAFTGNGLWCEDGAVSINNKSAIVSPAHELAGYEKVTVVVSAKSSTANSSSKFTVSTSLDSQEFAVTESSSFVQFVAVLNCDDWEQVTIAGKSSFPQFQNIQVYAGELDETRLRAVLENGDESYRLITGITDKSYTVSNLTAGGMFYYRVKALYIDGTSSTWSKSKSVTLMANGDVEHHAGDVDHDGQISIADVTTLIDYLLGNDGGVCTTCADVDGDSTISIADVTSLIDMLLSAH
jgi:hypothetical protein